MEFVRMCHSSQLLEKTIIWKQFKCKQSVQLGDCRLLVKRMLQHIQLAIIVSIGSVGIVNILYPVQKQHIGMSFRQVGTTFPPNSGQSTQYYQDTIPFRSCGACVQWNGFAGIGGTKIIPVI